MLSGETVQAELPVSVTVVADTLSQPTNPVWDNITKGKAKWDAVGHADGYIVSLYKDGAEVTSSPVADTQHIFAITGEAAIPLR